MSLSNFTSITLRDGPKRVVLSHCALPDVAMPTDVFDVMLRDVESTLSVKSQLPLRLIEKNPMDFFLFVVPPSQLSKEFTLHVPFASVTDIWYV